jgi:hypothetical protein
VVDRTAPAQVRKSLDILQRQFLTVFLDEKEPVATPSHVAPDLARPRHFHQRALHLAKAGHIADRHGTILMQRRRHHAHAGLDAVFARTDAPQVCQRGHQPDRSMPAHLEQPDVVEEDHTGNARLVRRLHQHRADEHIRSARLIHDRGTKRVVPIMKDLQLVGHSAATEVRPAAHDHTCRLTAGVGIDDLGAFQIM